MKHLIRYLQDGRKAADYLRQLRWPDGVKCPRCGSDAVEPRERCDNGLQRFNCVHCAVRWGQQFAMFRAFNLFYSLQQKRDNHGSTVATCRNILRNL